MRGLKLICLVCLFVSAAGCGITASGLKSDPGYARLVYPGWAEADKEFGLSLGPTALKAMFSLAQADKSMSEQEIAALKKIKGVRIAIYKVTDSPEKIGKYIASSVKQLKEDGWHQTVSVNDNGERAVVMIKFDDELVEGLSVLALDNEEAVFVNVIGDLDPAFFDEVMTNFGGEELVGRVEI